MDKEIVTRFIELAQKLPRPNPKQTWAEVVAEFRQYWILCGSAFLWCFPDTENPTEVHVISPTRVVLHSDGSYVVDAGAKTECRVNTNAIVSGRIKKQPLLQWDGYSPLTPLPEGQK